MSVYKNVKLWMQTENCIEKYKIIVETEHYFFYNLMAIRNKTPKFIAYYSNVEHFAV